MPRFKSSRALHDLEFDYEITEPLFAHPLILLHGNMASKRWWSLLVKQAEVSSWPKLYPALLIDFPGCGVSPKPNSLDLIDVRLFALAFSELLQQIHAENQLFQKVPCLIVGHSTGGLIAMLMLANEATRVARGKSAEDVSTSAFCGAITISSVGLKGIQSSVLQNKIDELISNDAQLLAVMKTTLLYSEKMQNFVANIAVPDARLALEQIGGSLLQSMTHQDFTAEFQRVSQPVLILFGEEDLVLSKQHAGQMSESLVNSKLIFLPETGHSMNVENPDQLLKIISEFVVDR